MNGDDIYKTIGCIQRDQRDHLLRHLYYLTKGQVKNSIIYNDIPVFGLTKSDLLFHTSLIINTTIKS